MENLPKKDGEGFSADYIRHSNASYKTYVDVAKSENSQQAFNSKEQLTPDLTEFGVELAKEEAEGYFANLDPEEDQLFFVSSNEARAIETANIYRGVAKDEGFLIIKPENARSEISEEIADGEIRVIENLSINSPNMLLDGVFNSPNCRKNTNLNSLTAEEKERYQKAIAIVNADDQGSWGANFAKHGASVKEILPEIKSPEDQYNTKFKNLLRLFKFGQEKTTTSGVEKKIKVLAFGHENMMVYALQTYFKENSLTNCEVVNFESDAGEINMSYREQKAKIDIE